MTCCTGWWMWILPMVILWWLFSAAMFYLAWNRVITAVTSAKKMTYGQAFLFVFALGVLAAPHHMRDNWHGNCKRNFQIQENQEMLKLSPLQE